MVGSAGQMSPPEVDALMRHEISSTLPGNAVIFILFLSKETEGIFYLGFGDFSRFGEPFLSELQDSGETKQCNKRSRHKNSPSNSP